MSFGSKLKKARLSKKMTQKQLADIISVKHNSISNWENDINKPDPDTIELLCGVLEVTPNYLLATAPEDFSPAEKLLIKKYRFISEHLPTGIEMVDYIIDHEYEEAMELKQRLDELAKQAAKIAELESKTSNIVEFQSVSDKRERMANYYHGVSAGSGVFIMGNESADQIPIPDTPENRNVDYAISVTGNSMEPDFYDGDIVLVSQREEIRYGDVGIFIVNGSAYIKEYDKTELVSRNPDVNNISISEFDNIVCMGKVIGKIENSESSLTPEGAEALRIGQELLDKKNRNIIKKRRK